MKLLMVITTLALLLSLKAGSLMAQEKTEKQKNPAQAEKMQKMSEMKEPHQLLAMAYRQNILNFARTLRELLAANESPNPEFARMAAAEIKRNFEQLEKHHEQHLQKMTANEEMRAKMSEMMKQMQPKHARLRETVAELERLAQSDAPDAKQMLAKTDELIGQMEMMPKREGKHEQ